MLGKITVIQEDKKAIFIELEKPADFKLNAVVNVSAAKKKRSLKQNALYWAFITWLIHPKGGNLKAQGHFSKDALHADIKAWIKSTHEHDFPIEKKFSTAELDTKKFGEFLDLVNEELMVEILGVDTSGFWKDYENYTKWVDYNDDDFERYLDEQVLPF